MTAKERATTKAKPRKTAARKAVPATPKRKRAPRMPQTRGDKNIAWIEKHIIVPEGALVGQRLHLRDWQKGIIKGIYDTPTRRAIISFGRKNGKTALAACLLLLHLVGPEKVQNGQLFSAAQSREQASILFSLAAKMVRMSVELSAFVHVKDTVKELICGEIGTRYRALSAEASTAYGLSPVFVVHDELGQVKGPRSELYDALETAAGAQVAPLSIIISTQAPTDADLLSLLIDDALKGEDKELKAWLYTAPIDEPAFDVDTIKKANPAYDDFQNAKEVQRQAATAKRLPSAEANYRNLILNQRVNVTQPFVTRSIWEANAAPPDFGAFDGGVYIGLDLSSRHDLTAAVAVVLKRGEWHVWPTFFLPEEGLRERSERDKVPYDLWVQQGFVETTPGHSVGYEHVARWLAAFCEDHNVASIRFDRWRIDVLRAEIKRLEIELPLEEFGQGFKSMDPALDVLESLLLEGKIRHGGNPVMNMCAANAVAVSNPAGGRKLAKDKSTGRIDGMVALAMAIGGASGTTQEEKPPLRAFVLG